MKKFFNVKTISLLLAVILLVGGAVGGTLAWIVAESGTVTNTFTYGDINITLDEAKLDANGVPTSERTTTGNDNYEMIPGNEIAKDPTITVKKGSEDCWLFVKLEKSTNFDSFMTFDIADLGTEWSALDGVDGVYYRTIKATEVAEADKACQVLKDNVVKVKDDVTKEALNNLTADTKPTLTVTAYAVQQANITSAAAAWTVATTDVIPESPTP